MVRIHDRPLRDAGFRLSDGRVLAHAEHGDPAGVPVFFFHGLPGSRSTRHPDATIAERLGVRLVTFDRPGIGASSPSPGRRIADWARDVEEFADANEIESFVVLGWSGGGPYALAVAHELPQRVRRVGLVAAVPPLAGTDFARHLSPRLRRRVRVARYAPWLVRMSAAHDVRRFRRNPGAALVRDFTKAPAGDRVVLADEALRNTLLDYRREGYEQGTRGVLEDALLYLRPWGFDPANVDAPVQLWHGLDDRTIGVELGRRLAEVLPSCEATFVPGEGHMICLTRWEEILREVAAPD